MRTGEEKKGSSRSGSIRLHHTWRVTGMTLAMKITLVNAAISALFLATFGIVVYKRTAGALDQEIDRFGASLVNGIATFDLITWEKKNNTFFEFRDWLRAHYEEFEEYLKESHGISYVPDESSSNGSAAYAELKPMRTKFFNMAEAKGKHTSKRPSRMLRFLRTGEAPEVVREEEKGEKPKGVNPGNILNVFVHREDSALTDGKQKKSVTAARSAMFGADEEETPYLVEIDGRKVETQVRIQQGHNRDTRERARLYHHPIYSADGTAVARAYVVLSEAKIQKRLGNLKLLVISLTVLGILVSAAGSFFVISRLTQPLRSLIEDIDIVASGDLNHRTQAVSNDEVGLVARTFDDMTQRMCESQKAEVKHEEIAHDVGLVREIHSKLLPATLPRIAGYDVDFFSQPSADIGADYYDVIEIDNDRTALVVAGLPGKGVAAAILMALTRTLIRAETQSGDAPAAILKRVNRTLSQDIRKGMYVTILLVILEPKSRRLTIASAGHPPVLFHQSKNDQIQSICPDGIALGLDQGKVFDQSLEELALDLESNDRIVLYTSGVIQTKDSAGRPFGEKRFQQLVKKTSPKNSSAFVNIVGSYLEKFRGSSTDPEDLTILTLKARG